MKNQSRCESKPCIDYIHRLEQILLMLANRLDENNVPTKNEYHVFIENLDVHSANLDELNFTLDTIDIKELSGAMNIGNTFGTTIEKKEKQTDTQKKEELLKKMSDIKRRSTQSKEQYDNHIKVVINGKTVSYSVSN